jgi:hypothetical protein
MHATRSTNRPLCSAIAAARADMLDTAHGDRATPILARAGHVGAAALTADPLQQPHHDNPALAPSQDGAAERRKAS